MSRVLDLAKKLAALAERGESGERDNAAAKLKELMDKHGITIEDIGFDTIKEHEYKIKHEADDFFVQVCASVLVKERLKVLHYKRQRTKIRSKFVICTDSEFIEIVAKFEFYYPIYIEESKVFYSAFIQKKQTLQPSN